MTRYALLLLLLTGCQQDQHFAQVDDCLCQVLAMQFQLEPSNVVATYEEEYIDELPPIPDAEIDSMYFANKLAIDEFWSRNPKWKLYDAVVTWAAIESIKQNCKPKQSAAAEGESATAVSKGSVPPAAESLFYEIILHTGKNCAPCERVKHELKVRSYPFTEHLVSTGSVPVAFIDGEEYVGENAICNRLKIVQLNRKDNAKSNKP